MPWLHRTALLTGLAVSLTVGLLPSLAVRAALPQSGPAVPVRSLAGELAGADEDTAVYIHTYYATGVGVLLSSRDGVVTARHNVLTPSGSFADEIAVGIAQMPLHNIVEVRVAAAAQDPAQDLVLLRPVQGAFPAATQQASSPHTPAECALPGAAAPCPPPSDSAPNKRDSTPRKEIQVKAGMVRTRQTKRARPHPAPRAAEEQTRAGVAQPVAIHVVRDGPIAKKATTAPTAPHSLAAKRRVVEDGPLRAR